MGSSRSSNLDTRSSSRGLELPLALLYFMHLRVYGRRHVAKLDIENAVASTVTSNAGGLLRPSVSV